MSKDKRNGNRKGRAQKVPSRVPELGYYVIITDNKATERKYFEGLRDKLPPILKDKLVIKVVNSKYKDMVKKALEEIAYDPQYRSPWIVLDRDKDENFDETINTALVNGISVAWSNPCFEIWMFAYFGEIPSIDESWICCSKFSDLYFKKTGQEYSKSDEDLYRHLCENGDEGKALEMAQLRYEQYIANGKNKPSEMCPCTTVFEIVKEIKSKTLS